MGDVRAVRRGSQSTRKNQVELDPLGTSSEVPHPTGAFNGGFGAAPVDDWLWVPSSPAEVVGPNITASVAEQPPLSGQAPHVPAAYTPPKPIEGRAIAALVVGIAAPLGAFLLFGVSGVILGAVAVFMGLTARSRIKRSGGVLGGGGLALAGWLLGLLGILVGAAWALYLFALFMAMSPGAGKG